IVILGSGLAGYTVAREFRKLDAAAPLVVVTRDDGAVYSKPMLSNALAGGRSAAALATADAASAAGQLNATVLARREIAAIDTAARTLTFADGERLQYSKLVLAIGADPIRVPLEGDAAAAVMQDNDLTDYARFRDAIEGAGHVTILGAGLIGCEFANDLLASGRKVDVIDPAGWPLGRLVPERVGRAFAAKLVAAGVSLRLGTTAQSVERRAEGGLRVRLADGNAIDTDAVLSAIGLRPRT